MASILRVKDQNGKIVDIPAIKGDSYILTEADKLEIKDAVLQEVPTIDETVEAVLAALTSAEGGVY